MRALALTLVALLAVPLAVSARAAGTPPIASADRTGRAPSDKPAETHAQKLDRLFSDLKRQPADVAAQTASAIEETWRESESATVDLLMLWSAQAMAKNENAAALDLLERAIVLKPDFPEAWNRRATLHYTMSNYGKSIVDIEQTLSLEPRHFGALMGLAMILEETDRKAKALDIYLRVLDIYPTLKGAQDAAARLSDELAGQLI